MAWLIGMNKWAYSVYYYCHVITYTHCAVVNYLLKYRSGTPTSKALTKQEGSKYLFYKIDGFYALLEKKSSVLCKNKVADEKSKGAI